MKSFGVLARSLFKQAIQVYLEQGGVDVVAPNPYQAGTIEYDLFLKNWIDHAQWALEDIIRDPEIDPQLALQIKRKIDRSNQERTDLVERIDSYFLTLYSSVEPQRDAKINTESPAWAIDRLSILQLKIHYMTKAQAEAKTKELRAKNTAKLAVLLEQDKDLCTAIDELLSDIEQGCKYMKVYKQMKMYNDPELNPILKGREL
ncbi:MAG: DUF4254 domain-containing protein [Porphyromonadaceae bacterium]|nr:DUF4254 domain-containing protein [Porphyromonadaceae bacterium]